MYYNCCGDLEKILEKNNFDIYFFLLSCIEGSGQGIVKVSQYKIKDLHSTFCNEYNSDISLRAFSRGIQQLIKSKMVLIRYIYGDRYYAIPKENSILIHHSVFYYISYHLSNKMKRLLLIISIFYKENKKYFYIKDVLNYLGGIDYHSKSVKEGLCKLRDMGLIDWEYTGKGYKMRLLNVNLEAPLKSDFLNVDLEILNGEGDKVNEEE